MVIQRSDNRLLPLGSEPGRSRVGKEDVGLRKGRGSKNRMRKEERKEEGREGTPTGRVQRESLMRSRVGNEQEEKWE